MRSTVRSARCARSPSARPSRPPRGARRPDLARITAPTLAVGGSLDIATPLDHARELADGIADATLKACAIGHLAVEQPEAVGAALSTHLRAPKGPQC
ncbi:alpha/beta fold hydrolase [Streptomyces sp. NPDC056713]|uniref:alpha/beta fold hydrolase n=1 Tax=Streptomyces sp. NPDC056713 TaxID=3345921 RepID=UPI0036761C09